MEPQILKQSTVPEVLFVKLLKRISEGGLMGNPKDVAKIISGLPKEHRGAAFWYLKNAFEKGERFRRLMIKRN